MSPCGYSVDIGRGSASSWSGFATADSVFVFESVVLFFLGAKYDSVDERDNVDTPPPPTRVRHSGFERRDTRAYIVNCCALCAGVF